MALKELQDESEARLKDKRKALTKLHKVYCCSELRPCLNKGRAVQAFHFAAHRHEQS